MPDETTKHTSAAKAWVWVAVWYAVILLTIPFARTIQRWLEALLHGQISVVALFVLAGMLACSFVYVARYTPGGKKRRLIWLVTLAASAVWVVGFRLQTPIEVIHFVQYGILSVFLYRAWIIHSGDEYIFLASLVCVFIAAYIDEFVQWMFPGRYWDFRDISLNIIAGGIIQLFIARVVKPDGISEKTETKSVRISCRLSWAVLILMAFALWNTPARVDSYASRIPFLQFLVNNESVMVEYGYRHHDPDIGTFYSRLTLDEIAQTDKARGDEAAAIISDSIDTMSYPEFLELYSPTRDPFMHELRVHLYRRDHYHDTAPQYKESDPSQYEYHLLVMDRENQLLKKYYPASSASLRLNKDALEMIKNIVDSERKYRSPVSDHLITRMSMVQNQVVLLVLAAGMGMLYVKYGSDKKAHE